MFRRNPIWLSFTMSHPVWQSPGWHYMLCIGNPSYKSWLSTGILGCCFGVDTKVWPRKNTHQLTFPHLQTPGEPSVPFRQLWLVLGVKIKLMEINSNLFSRHLQTHTDTPPKPLVALAGNRHSYHSYHSYHSHHPSTCIRGPTYPEKPKSPPVYEENPFICCILEYLVKNVLGVCFKEIS